MLLELMSMNPELVLKLIESVHNSENEVKDLKH